MSTSGTASARAALVVAVLFMLLLGLVTLGFVVLETGVAGFLVGLLLALLPLPIYLGLALWIDRYEKEPFAMLALAFLWGSSVALFISYILNSMAGALMTELVGESAAQVGGAVLSAPLVEETAKGAALFLLFFLRRHDFDNVTDGIVYAAVVGLGFATIENVLYYGNAFREGVPDSVIAFLLRGVMSPYSHPLFTAMTGVGLGLAREAHGGATKWTAPLGGLALAVALHSAWNLSASLGAAFFLTYLFIMVPFFLAVIGLVVWSLRREREVLHTHLSRYAEAGELTPTELHLLATTGSRLRDRWAAARAEGWPGWRRTGEFHRAAGELAFHGWRRSRGISRAGEADHAREREMLERLRSSRPLRGRPPVVPPSTPRE